MSVPVLVRVEGARERKSPAVERRKTRKRKVVGVLWGCGFLLVSLLFALVIWKKGVRFCGGVLVTLLGVCFGHNLD